MDDIKSPMVLIILQGDLTCLRLPPDPNKMTYPVEDLFSLAMACGTYSLVSKALQILISNRHRRNHRSQACLSSP
jgi:hypothetical protein